MSSDGDWFDRELCWISGHSYQIIESSFSQKFYYTSFRGRLKEGSQWVNCVVLITTLLQHCTFKEYVLNCQSLATMLASSWWSSGKIWDFVALVWPIRSRVITTSSALVRCRNILGGPSVGFRRYRSLPCIDTSHLIWTSCWIWSLPVASNLQSGQSSVGLFHGQGSPLLAGPLSNSPLCHNGLAPSRSGHKCLCRSMPRGDSWSGK